MDAVGLDHVSYTYPDGPQALRDVSLMIPAGQFMALVGLDGLWRQHVIAWLMAHQEAGRTILMVTHHMRLAAKVERIVMMCDGQIAREGTAP